MRHIVLAVVIAVGGSMAPGALNQVAAQEPSQAYCDSVSQVIQTGDPNSGDLSGITRCPFHVWVIGDYLIRIKGEPDTSKISLAFGIAQRLRHSNISTAARQVAADPDATIGARVRSLAVLIGHERSLPFILYADLVGTPEGKTCRMHLALGSIGGAPLGETSTNRQLAEAIEQNAGNPPEVRSAARCLIWATKDVGQWEPVEMTTLNVGAIDLTYLCGNRFRIRNPNAMYVTVDYAVDGTSEHGIKTLPPRENLDPYRDIVLKTTNSGTVRISYKGQLLRTAPNEGTPCPE